LGSSLVACCVSHSATVSRGSGSFSWVFRYCPPLSFPRKRIVLFKISSGNKSHETIVSVFSPVFPSPPAPRPFYPMGRSPPPPSPPSKARFSGAYSSQARVYSGFFQEGWNSLSHYAGILLSRPPRRPLVSHGSDSLWAGVNRKRFLISSLSRPLSPYVRLSPRDSPWIFFSEISSFSRSVAMSGPFLSCQMSGLEGAFCTIPQFFPGPISCSRSKFCHFSLLSNLDFRIVLEL